MLLILHKSNHDWRSDWTGWILRYGVFKEESSAYKSIDDDVSIQEEISFIYIRKAMGLK